MTIHLLKRKSRIPLPDRNNKTPRLVVGEFVVCVLFFFGPAIIQQVGGFVKGTPKNFSAENFSKPPP